jgi:hypothetical protein
MSIKVSYVEQASVVNSQLSGKDISAVIGATKLQHERKGHDNSGHAEKLASQQKNNELGRC